MGLPCVTSVFGLNGVEASPGHELLVFNDPDQAARQILNLHADPALRLRMASARHQLVSRRYNWESIYRAFADSCLQTAAQHPAWAPAFNEDRTHAA